MVWIMDLEYFFLSHTVTLIAILLVKWYNSIQD